ncbi:hypothetical protein [Mesorhizobium sp.]|uniref:hypothetical protein n=1 Tax=Mesorhizobium sp. TaxID=1871066 RepID=UPI0025B8D3D7|nr:hypothetical protein [Mesorhizobium sp.]
MAETALASIGQRSSHAKETDHEHDISQTEIAQYEAAGLKIDRDTIRSLAKRAGESRT